MIAQITAPHFCAGISFDSAECVVEAAPIVRYMIGWSRQRVRDYCRSKNWSAKVVTRT
jgi:hypothetical protein